MENIYSYRENKAPGNRMLGHSARTRARETPSKIFMGKHLMENILSHKEKESLGNSKQCILHLQEKRPERDSWVNIQ